MSSASIEDSADFIAAKNPKIDFTDMNSKAANEAELFGRKAKSLMEFLTTNWSR